MLPSCRISRCPTWLGRADFTNSRSASSPGRWSPGGVVYECGKGSWVFLYPSGGAGTSKASQAFWQVEDLEAEVKALKDRGVIFEDYDMPGLKTVNGIAATPGNKAAWFKDPDGNIMALIQSDPAKG